MGLGPLATLDSDNPSEGIKQRWGTLEGRKGDLISRCEQYAQWTIPSVCPVEGEAQSIQSRGNVAIGSRLVNHLANRIVDTMFPNDRPFFALAITPEAEQKLTGQMSEDELSQFRVAYLTATAKAEEDCMRALNLTSYRPMAVHAVAHQIVTGNATIKRLEDETRVVYGIKDYCVVRDIRGEPIEAILKDAKTFSALPDDIKAAYKAKHAECTPDTQLTLYTHYKWDQKRWREEQAIEELDLGNPKYYPPVDMPVIFNVWDLSRGEDYGRGLVEANSTLFHNVDVVTLAMLDLIGIAADIKFLVNPASGLDVEELNRSPRGSYHLGAENDISTPKFPKTIEIQILQEAIQAWERQLSMSFLLNNGAVRDAERVTAEEIRFYARELESAFGGLYSRLALKWQKLEADWLISKIDFNLYYKGMKTLDVVVTTGMESLSREGQLDNLRLAVADLQMLEAVPEDIRAAINAEKFARFIFLNRGVKGVDFLYTQSEMNARQQAAQQQQEQLIEKQGAVDAAAKASTEQ